jgi:hypothetical protein
MTRPADSAGDSAERPVNNNPSSAAQPATACQATVALQPFRRPLDERSLYNQGIQIGFDGSLLRDGAEVYVLCCAYDGFDGSLLSDGGGGARKLDYFHGLINGVPMGQMEEDEADVSATEMINMSQGFTALRITNLQRRWRCAKAMMLARRYEKSMIAFCVAIAQILRRQRKKALIA